MIETTSSGSTAVAALGVAAAVVSFMSSRIRDQRAKEALYETAYQEAEKIWQAADRVLREGDSLPADIRILMLLMLSTMSDERKSKDFLSRFSSEIENEDSSLERRGQADIRQEIDRLRVTRPALADDVHFVMMGAIFVMLAMYADPVRIEETASEGATHPFMILGRAISALSKAVSGRRDDDHHDTFGQPASAH